jgi:hypothetical protein
MTLNEFALFALVVTGTVTGYRVGKTNGRLDVLQEETTRRINRLLRPARQRGDKRGRPAVTAATTEGDKET